MSVQINGTNGLTFNDGSSQQTAATGFGFKNRILNGDFRIDQRNAGASVTPAPNVYTLDRWQSQASQVSKYSIQQTTTTPSGFINSLKVTSLSAYTVGSGDFFAVIQAIEGYNISDLAWGTASATPVTLSFRVQSSLTGTFGGSIVSGSGSYPFTYTISSANTWTAVSVTISANTAYAPTSTTNGVGIYVCFGLGCGSNISGTAGSWQSGFLESATGATSVVGTNGATFYITGVQLEKGSTATSFDYRPYGLELALCQRYYYKLKAVAVGDMLGTGYCVTTTAGTYLTTFPVTMRTNPTALEQSGTAGDYSTYTGNATLTTCSSVPTFSVASQSNARTIFTVASGLTAGQGSFARAVNSNAYLAWSAEL